KAPGVRGLREVHLLRLQEGRLLSESLAQPASQPGFSLSPLVSFQVHRKQAFELFPFCLCWSITSLKLNVREALLPSTYPFCKVHRRPFGDQQCCWPAGQMVSDQACLVRFFELVAKERQS